MPRVVKTLPLGRGDMVIEWNTPGWNVEVLSVEPEFEFNVWLDSEDVADALHLFLTPRSGKTTLIAIRPDELEPPRTEPQELYFEIGLDQPPEKRN